MLYIFLQMTYQITKQRSSHIHRLAHIMRCILQLIEILQRVLEQIHKVKEVVNLTKPFGGEQILMEYTAFTVTVLISCLETTMVQVFQFSKKILLLLLTFFLFCFFSNCVCRVQISHTAIIFCVLIKTYIGFFFYMSYRYSCAVNYQRLKLCYDHKMLCYDLKYVVKNIIELPACVYDIP